MEKIRQKVQQDKVEKEEHRRSEILICFVLFTIAMRVFASKFVSFFCSDTRHIVFLGREEGETWVGCGRLCRTCQFFVA